MPFLLAAGLLFLTDTAIAAESSFDAASSVLQMLLGLGVVIGLLYLSLHALRRIGGARGRGAALMKIRGATAVGPRERVVLLEVADKIIVLGIAPGRISTLHTLDSADLPADDEGNGPPPAPAGKDFQAWLKQTLERRTR